MSGIFHIIMGTAGHIDHGKSSLVKSLTGIDPDRLKEEKERGLTIDLGFAPFTLPDGREIGIIDVPGHEKFVKNMVAGATSIDLVLLVIAADDGVMPQTREHLEIMQLLNIQRGIIALTKIDMVDQEMRELVSEDIRELVQSTFLQGAPIVPVSNVTGEGMELLKKTIYEHLERITPHSSEGVFRMPIQRIFSSHGYGTVITGVPVSGTIQIGDSLEILPDGLVGRVKKIQAYNKDVACAQAGHSTALNIKDVDYKEILRGHVAVLPGYFQPSRFFEGKFYYAKNMERPLSYLTSIRFHTGTLEEVGKLAILGKDRWEPGEEGYVQIRLDNPVLALPGDHFVLRLASPTITIGGGTIIGSGDKKLKRFRGEVLHNLEEKAQSLGNVAARLEIFLKNDMLSPIKEDELAKAVQRETAEVKTILQELCQEGTVVSLVGQPARYVHAVNLELAEQKVKQKVEAFFQQHPYRLYVAKIKIQNELAMDSALWELAWNSLSKKGLLQLHRDTFALPGREVALSPAQQQIKAQINDCFCRALFTPPLVEELPQLLHKAAKEIEPLVEFLENSGTLIAVAKGILFHQEAITQAQTLITDTIRQRGELVSADFRDLVNTSRKYAIPLLEYFDQTGVTVRQGNSRVLKK